MDTHQCERDRTIRQAEYTLEYAARCPHCREEVELLHVARLLRTRVNFTSNLPRRGHFISCPQCHTIISADLLGFAQDPGQGRVGNPILTRVLSAEK